MSLGERLYRLTLRAYPSDYRADYGSDMLRAFQALESDFRARGRLRYLRFLLAELGGTLSQAIRERLTQVRVQSSRGRLGLGVPTGGGPRKSGVADGWIQDSQEGSGQVGNIW